MKTKYIKVSVSERLPRKVRTDVIVLWTNEEETISAGSGFFTEKGYWWVYDSGCSVPEYWLEEKPDYEEEIHQMLLRIQDLDILPLEIEDELSLLLKKIRIQ